MYMREAYNCKCTIPYYLYIYAKPSIFLCFLTLLWMEYAFSAVKPICNTTNSFFCSSVTKSDERWILGRKVFTGGEDWSPLFSCCYITSYWWNQPPTQSILYCCHSIIHILSTSKPTKSSINQLMILNSPNKWFLLWSMLFLYRIRGGYVTQDETRRDTQDVISE